MHGQGLLLFIGLIMITSLQNIAYFRCSKLFDVDGSKRFDKDGQATKYIKVKTMFNGLVIFIKNFDPIDIRRP